MFGAGQRQSPTSFAIDEASASGLLWSQYLELKGRVCVCSKSGLEVPKSNQTPGTMTTLTRNPRPKESKGGMIEFQKELCPSPECDDSSPL